MILLVAVLADVIVKSYQDFAKRKKLASKSLIASLKFSVLSFSINN
jgi:Tfp pilus assembly protein PilE